MLISRAGPKEFAKAEISMTFHFLPHDFFSSLKVDLISGPQLGTDGNCSKIREYEYESAAHLKPETETLFPKCQKT